MKTELSKSLDPRDKGRITESELTPNPENLSDYNQGLNHGLELALMDEVLVLSEATEIQRLWMALKIGQALVSAGLVTLDEGT